MEAGRVAGAKSDRLSRYENRVIIYVDEAAARRTVCYLLPFLSRTAAAAAWALKAQTPVIRKKQDEII